MARSKSKGLPPNVIRFSDYAKRRKKTPKKPRRAPIGSYSGMVCALTAFGRREFGWSDTHCLMVYGGVMNVLQQAEQGGRNG